MAFPLVLIAARSGGFLLCRGGSCAVWRPMCRTRRQHALDIPAQRDPSTFARICQAGDAPEHRDSVVAGRRTGKPRRVPMQARKASA